MLLHLEQPDYDHVLRGADGRSAKVNDRVLVASFVLSPTRLLENWPVVDIRTVTVADLEPLWALEPELILLGSGATQAFPPAQVLAASLGRGIGLESMTNAAAARTFNVLASEGRRVVAGFVLGS